MNVSGGTIVPKYESRRTHCRCLIHTPRVQHGSVAIHWQPYGTPPGRTERASCSVAFASFIENMVNGMTIFFGTAAVLVPTSSSSSLTRWPGQLASWSSSAACSLLPVPSADFDLRSLLAQAQSSRCSCCPSFSDGCGLHSDRPPAQDTILLFCCAFMSASNEHASAYVYLGPQSGVPADGCLSLCSRSVTE